ncbi:MAG: hypothetical protein KJ621_09170, partial [Proteobacteria bacterium]|nr:hypothetical protein [Pseudomonadota bacterium]
MTFIWENAKRHWQAVISLSCLALALFLSGCVTTGPAAETRTVVPVMGRVVPADLTPLDIKKLLSECSKYNYYWSGTVIQANSFQRAPIYEVGAVLIVPKGVRVEIAGQDWKRLNSCPWAPRGRFRSWAVGERGRDSDRPDPRAILDERGRVIGYVISPAAVAMSVLARGKSGSGARVYEVTAVARLEPNGPGGASGG